jgi:hypothetical protein
MVRGCSGSPEADQADPEFPAAQAECLEQATRAADLVIND